MQWQLNTAEELQALGAKFAEKAPQSAIIFLNGQLGAGKTTFSQGFLEGLGFKNTVKSPTYTLVETYNCVDRLIYHFDLYRLHDPEELEFIGIRDYFANSSLCLIEWPDKGAGFLPEPDIFINIEPNANNLGGRKVIASAKTTKGENYLALLNS